MKGAKPDMKISKLLSVILGFTVISASIPYSTAIADTSNGDDPNASVNNETIDCLPNYISQAYDMTDVVEVSELNATDEYSVTFLNNDDTYSLLQFMTPIKYYDSNSSSYRFIDNEIINSKETGYEFENKANSFLSLFPYSSSDGIVFKDSDYSVKMIPVSNNNNSADKVVSDYNSECEFISYGDVYGTNTDLRYYIENNGLKETLILNECPDFSTYSFELQVEGLEIKEQSGSSIILYDIETGEEILKLNPVFIQDSSDYFNTTYNNTYSVETIDYNNYLVTVNMDEEFLNSDETVYPCTVDPTIYYTRMGTLSGSYATQSGNTVLSNYYQAGSFNGVGECITYIKVNGLENKKWLNPNNILECTMTFKDCSAGYYNSGTITCYDSNSILNVNNVSYSQLVSAIGMTVDSVAVSSVDCYYDFDITYLLKKWISNQIGQGGFTYNYGCIFRGNSNLIGRRAYGDGTTSHPYIEIKFTHDYTIENGIYKISSATNQKYIQNNGLSQNVTATSTTISESGKWRIKNDGNGLYTIQPYNDSSKYLYVSSTNANTNLTISSSEFKWYITANNNGTFRLMPAPSASVSTASTYSSGNVVLSDYSNDTTKNWEIKPLYHFDLVHYYDNGHEVRFGNSATNIASYQDVVSKIQMNLFGLKTDSSIQSYTSCADNCTGTPVVYSDTVTGCVHSTEHKSRYAIYSDIISQFSSGTNTLSRVAWTGHALTDNQSASYSSGNTIVVTIGMVTDSSHNNLSDDVIRKERIFTLLHESSHQLGAPDHYCYNPSSTTGCSNPNCWRCYRHLSQLPDCAMSYRMYDLESKLNNDNMYDIFCDECMSSTNSKGIVTHLEDHHVN